MSKRPEGNMVMRSVYLPEQLDDDLRTAAFWARRSKGDLIREFVASGLARLNREYAQTNAETAVRAVLDRGMVPMPARVDIAEVVREAVAAVSDRAARAAAPELAGGAGMDELYGGAGTDYATGFNRLEPSVARVAGGSGGLGTGYVTNPVALAVATDPGGAWLKMAGFWNGVEPVAPTVAPAAAPASGSEAEVSAHAAPPTEPKAADPGFMKKSAADRASG